MNRTRTAGLWLAFATALISGVAVFVNGHGVRSFDDSGVYTTAKNMVAAVVLLGVVLAGRRSAPMLTRPSKPVHWRLLAVVGVIGGSVPFLLFFEGLSRASSVEAAFLQKTLVVWVALLAVPLLGERIGVLQWAAVALLLLGQASIAGGVTDALRMPWSTGEMMVLIATWMWAVEVIVVKRLLGDLTSWTVAMARMWLGSAILIGWELFQGNGAQLVHLTREQLGWVILTGVLLAAYVATWFAALARAERLVAAVPAGALPHHSFHVFGVYPWVGLLRTGSVDQALHVLDRCRIRWGRVESLTGDIAQVRSRPLRWDGRSLSLGPPEMEQVTAGSDGHMLVPGLAVGDWVAMHWDWVCDRLSPARLAALRHYSAGQLAVVNVLDYPAPATVLS